MLIDSLLLVLQVLGAALPGPTQVPIMCYCDPPPPASVSPTRKNKFVFAGEGDGYYCHLNIKDYIGTMFPYSLLRTSEYVYICQ